MEQQRHLRLELPKVAYRQFEVRGYDKMIERILEPSIKSSQSSNNKELENKLLLIKDQLAEQVKNNEDYLKLDDGGGNADGEESKTTQVKMEVAKQREKGQEPDEEEYDSEGESYYDEEDEGKEVEGLEIIGKKIEPVEGTQVESEGSTDKV